MEVIGNGSPLQLVNECRCYRHSRTGRLDGPVQDPGGFFDDRCRRSHYRNQRNICNPEKIRCCVSSDRDRMGIRKSIKPSGTTRMLPEPSRLAFYLLMNKYEYRYITAKYSHPYYSVCFFW